jgi:hypothetical protein
MFFLVGFALAGLSLCLPWFHFSGLAESSYGSVPVEGEVSAFGTGKLYSTSAKVVMWASDEWRSDRTDFWFGRLIILGLLFEIPALILAVVKKLWILTLIPLALIMAAPISALAYKPMFFIITGRFFQRLTFVVVYGTEATIQWGLGIILAFLGSFFILTGTALGWKNEN